VSPRSAESKRVHLSNETSLALYDETARAASAAVLRRYSSSFGAGNRLLPRPMREHIESVYAMVRIADEIVDTYRGPQARRILDDFESEVRTATEHGFSANVVAHAFGVTARAVGIGPEQTVPFFASMRMDLDVTEHTAESFRTYVFGSAEVVGEMCLAVFVNTGTGPHPLDDVAREGARRLGAAYQKINFLRDLATDSGELGRTYFPGVTRDSLTDQALAALVADASKDIRAARAALSVLARRPLVAVRTTIDIYERLLRKIAATPAPRLVEERVRVAGAVKLAYVVRNTVAPTRWLAR
jgi:phytoene synthase